MILQYIQHSMHRQLLRTFYVCERVLQNLIIYECGHYDGIYVGIHQVHGIKIHN